MVKEYEIFHVIERYKDVKASDLKLYDYCNHFGLLLLIEEKNRLNFLEYRFKFINDDGFFHYLSCDRDFQFKLRFYRRFGEIDQVKKESR